MGPCLVSRFLQFPVNPSKSSPVQGPVDGSVDRVGRSVDRMWVFHPTPDTALMQVPGSPFRQLASCRFSSRSIFFLGSEARRFQGCASSTPLLFSFSLYLVT